MVNYQIVNGLRTGRPLKPSGLSHVGLFYDDPEKTLEFYVSILGLSITDVGARAYLGGGEAQGLVFVRAGPEHHCISLFPRDMRLKNDDSRIQHAAWYIQTYSELLSALDFLSNRGFKSEFLVRRMPGSNYAVYFLDPEGNRVELAYGLELIGWNGRPKPQNLWKQFLIEGALPEAPIKSAEDEIDELRDELNGFGYEKCTYSVDKNQPLAPRSGVATFDASGESRPRPFKIVRIGYYSLCCNNLASQTKFYQQVMGLNKLKGEKGEVLFYARFREDPQLKLLPGQKQQSKLADVTFQLRSYNELIQASSYLKSKNVEIHYEGRESSPNIHNEFKIKMKDPSENPISLSFSPTLNGLKQQGKLRARRGLPTYIECD